MAFLAFLDQVNRPWDARFNQNYRQTW